MENTVYSLNTALQSPHLLCVMRKAKFVLSYFPLFLFKFGITIPSPNYRTFGVFFTELFLFSLGPKAGIGPPCAVKKYVT